jgi:RNA polymerase sigma-70 factor (ECF subfamily)
MKANASLPSLDSVQEMALWRSFKAGDQRAFAEMYQRYVRVLYHYGFRVTPNAALIEDSIQDLFIELWRMRENLSDTTSIKYYLFRSLRRRISRKLNSDPLLNEPAELDDLLDALRTPSFETHLVQQQAHDESIQNVQTGLHRLTRRQREAVQLRYYDNLSYQEMSARMSLNYQSVCNLIHEALSTLRRHVVMG